MFTGAGRQIMRQEHLVPCQPRPFRVTTQADAEAAACMPDLVKRDFTAERPGVKFVGDITYIHTWQGFIYLATVIDCYSKKVIGWSIADHMRTELVETALRNAAATAVIEPDAIFHCDRGSVYTSAGYRALVAGLGMRSSMGRTGVCWDCEHRDCATTWGLTLAYDRPCGCPRVDVSAPGGGVHQAAGRVGSDLIGA